MTDPVAMESSAQTRPAREPAAEGRRFVLRGSAWVLAGQGASQALRLGSNLVLTRLLAPELFGLMALVNAVNRGVVMFADVGLRGNVVHHPRGDDPAFLRTVFTIQVLRGLVLWAVVWALAGPAAAFYDEPLLGVWIPVMGAAAVLGGFQSTSLYTLIRHVRPRPRVLLELAAQTVSIAVMVVWAWLAPGLAALVAGSLVSALLLCVGSHALLPGRDGFGMEREALRDILRFGRWIFLSTALTFLMLQADRLVLGGFLDVGTLGVYSIAAMLSAMVVDVVTRLSVSILFPVFAQFARNESPAIRSQVTRLRLGVLALGLPPLWLIAIVGPELVRFLYDARYAEAGPMAQVLAVGAIASVLAATQERLLLALGRSDHHLGAQAVGAATVLGGIALGGAVGGLFGALVGLAAGRWLGYAAVVYWVRRHGLWVPLADAAVVMASAVAIGGGLWLWSGAS